jgi:hypothetical protein
VARRQVTRGLIAAAVTALALTGCGDDYEKGAGVYTAEPTTTQTAPATTPSAPAEEPTQTTGAEGTESHEAELTAAQRRAAREASSAARVFLEGYLPYSYSQAKASEIRGLTPQLRDELTANPPRVPPALAEKAQPRLRELETSGVTTGRVILLAQVDDGERRYASLVTLTRRGDRWVVSQVQ